MVETVVNIGSHNAFSHISLEGLESHECHIKKEGERREGWQTKRERKEREEGKAGVCVCVWVGGKVTGDD